MKRPRIAITGGIACGKSLAAKFLAEEGVATIDADDIVHELVPEEERRRLAAVVFKEPAARKALEARLHPIVKTRIREALDRSGNETIAVVPLLFEVQWDAEYDIICTITSAEEVQIKRMMTTRGMTRGEAEARLASQMPVAEKAERSQYVIRNDGTAEELKEAVRGFVRYLKEYRHGR